MNKSLQRLLRVGMRVSGRAVRRPSRPHGVILLYHRVAAPPWDPWHNCVRPERFAQHLAVLSRAVDIVPLSTLQSRLRAGRRQRPVVALTFDDGYADNVHVALPLLEKYGVPATVFVATGWIDRAGPFWWDELTETVAAMPKLPAEVRLAVGNEEHAWRGPSDDEAQHEARNRLLGEVFGWLLNATDEGRRDALNQLRSYASGDVKVDPATRPMTTSELCRLVSSPLIEIGAHTRSHCSLPDLPRDAQLAEIQSSSQQCTELVGTPPSSFAYPFGGLDSDTPELVRIAGFERACTTENDLVWAGCNPLLLPRIQVRNYSVGHFTMRLKMEWLP